MKTSSSLFSDLYRGKNVFVTGHTGFKGSWLCEWLLQLGAEVSGFSISNPTNPSHFEVLCLKDRMHHRIEDVRNANALLEAIQSAKPEIVFHLAAQPIVFESYQDPLTTFSTNVMGTANLLEALRKTPTVKAAVIVTSDKCYENVEWEFGYRETDRLGGKDPYSASKAGAEIVFHAYYKSFFERESTCAIATARAGNVIGGGDWAKDRIVPDCIRAWADNLRPLIRSPKSVRPWQHVLEPLSGYLVLGEQLYRKSSGIQGAAFNFGPSLEKPYSVLELIGETEKTWGLNQAFEIATEALPKKEAGLLFLNCDRAHNRLSWLPTLSFSESCEMTGDWYRSFYQGSAEKAATTTRAQIQKYIEFAKSRKRQWTGNT